MQNSKVNTVLLVILIILAAVLLWFTVGKKDTTVNTQQSASDVSQTSTQNTNNNTGTTTTTTGNTTTTTTTATAPAEKQYSGIGIHFSYNAKATTWLSKSGSLTTTNVGTSTADPFAESIVFSDMLFATNGYIKRAPETYGSNTFDVYQGDENGTKAYVLNSGRGIIIVKIPFRPGGNDTTQYIDLASVSFNQ